MHDYKSHIHRLIAARISATLVNTETHTDTAFDRLCISSAELKTALYLANANCTVRFMRNPL